MSVTITYAATSRFLFPSQLQLQLDHVVVVLTIFDHNYLHIKNHNAKVTTNLQFKILWRLGGKHYNSKGMSSH